MLAEILMARGEAFPQMRTPRLVERTDRLAAVLGVELDAAGAGGPATTP